MQLCRKRRDTTTVRRFAVMSLLFSFDLEQKSEFGRHILAEIPDIKFHAIRPAGAKVFHAHRRTDTTKLIVTCRHTSVKARKNCPSLVKGGGGGLLSSLHLHSTPPPPNDEVCDVEIVGGYLLAVPNSGNITVPNLSLI